MTSSRTAVQPLPAYTGISAPYTTPRQFRSETTSVWSLMSCAEVVASMPLPRDWLLLGGLRDHLGGHRRRFVVDAVAARPGLDGQIGHHRQRVLACPPVGFFLRGHLGDQVVLDGGIVQLPQVAGLAVVDRDGGPRAVLPRRRRVVDELLCLVRRRV